MQTTKILGTVLLIAAIILGYFGVTKVANSSSEVKVLGLEIDASNESGKKKAICLLVLP
ncbi:hypothetical protein [Flavobacterium sp. N2820]|jgi:hypothetical protein|uniref:hypothetical protein n=1 Tax=Flavobacterium sp. N2820 TaxID=2986834 RepID=UPI0022250DC1|nr:hypothetical protein [Flavobacterium sp. N2820]